MLSLTTWQGGRLSKTPNTLCIKITSNAKNPVHYGGVGPTHVHPEYQSLLGGKVPNWSHKSVKSLFTITTSTHTIILVGTIQILLLHIFSVSWYKTS